MRATRSGRRTARVRSTRGGSENCSWCRMVGTAALQCTWKSRGMQDQFTSAVCVRNACFGHMVASVWDGERVREANKRLGRGPIQAFDDRMHSVLQRLTDSMVVQAPDRVRAPRHRVQLVRGRILRPRDRDTHGASLYGTLWIICRRVPCTSTPTASPTMF